MSRFAGLTVCWLLALFLFAVSSRTAVADILVFNDQPSYVASVLALGFAPVREGFEDDDAWGLVRSTISGGFQTAPSVTHLGITWTSNQANSEVTTGSGAARTGEWGFYSYPHGDPPAIGDGFTGTSSSPIYGVGGWIRTNTPPAGISLWLDKGLSGEWEVDFQGNDSLDTGHRFFGAINTDGFTRFDFLETEFGNDELKFIFADDFTFAMTAIPEPEPWLAIAMLLGLALFSSRRRFSSAGSASKGHGVIPE